MPAPAPDGLDKPSRIMMTLLKSLSGGLVGRGDHADRVRPATGRALSRAIEPFFRSAAGGLRGWQQAVAQAQVARRSELQAYVEATLPEASRAVALAAAPVLDVPAGFELVPGPQPYPVLNWIQAVLGELARDRIRAEEFQTVLEALWTQFADGMRRLEQDSDPLRSTRGPKGCREALASLQVLQEFQDGNRAALAAGLERLLAALEVLDGVYLDGMARALEAGPSRTPDVNWLLHAIMASEDRLLGPDALTAARREIRDRATGCYYDLEIAAARYAGGPAEMLDQAPRARDALAILATLEVDPVVLLDAGDVLGEAHGVFTGADEPAGQMPCPHCGHPNDQIDRVCEDCGGLLPWQAETAPGGGKVSDHLHVLIEACEQIQADEISAQDFSGYLREGFARLRRVKGTLERLPDLQGLGFQVMGVHQMLTRGVEEMGAALDQLHDFLVDRKLSRLSKGLRTLVEAGRQLEQVRDITFGAG
ncbi:MAG: zinc ribbon domain-containing protein [Armatimonadetes bacterium]|nr:zinc ribbon domain-containing protein [Armatimonadota bacterium]